MNRSARSAWLSGLAVGAAGGFAALEIPVVGWPVVIAFAIPALLSTTRVAATGGLLFGIGAAWTALLGRVAVTCDPADCRAPGIESWLAVGLTFGALGVVLTTISVLRRPGRR